MLETAEAELSDGRVAIIRLGLPEDAEAITNFVNIVGSEKRFVLRERATWSIEDEQKTLAAADGTESAFLIALINGRLSGLLNIAKGRWPKNQHVAEFGMACLSDCRGVGLGTALLLRALDWARSTGVQKVRLEVFASNEPAISLYRKLGFVEEGRLSREFLIEGSFVDGVLMAKWLS
jgi:RimJ/RimL family protein N-acetyltransferase